jgi:hypothetical protein
LPKELLARYGTPTLFVSEDIQAARARHDVAIGLIRKPYDAKMIPAVVQFMDQLAQGHRPRLVPVALELFA